METGQLIYTNVFSFLSLAHIPPSLFPSSAVSRTHKTFKRGSERTRARSVLTAPQFQELPHTFLEIYPRLDQAVLYEAHMCSQHRDVGGAGEGGGVYCSSQEWIYLDFKSNSGLGKHLDDVQGAGYPKIPPKGILSFLPGGPVCFGSGFVALGESKTFL